MDLQKPTLTSYIDHARANIMCPGNSIPVSAVAIRNVQLADEWLEWLRDTANRAPGTVYNYASEVARYMDLLVRDRPLDAVTAQEVEQYLLRPRTHRAHGQMAAPATRARNVAVLKSWYRWLHARGHVTVNVAEMLVAPTVHNRQPKAIADETWLGVWNQIVNPVDRLMVGLGFFLGLRRAEIAALTVDHVDTARRQLVSFPRKGGGEDTLPYGEILDVWSQAMPELAGGWGVDDLEASLQARITPSDSVCGLSTPNAVNKRLAVILVGMGAIGAFTPHALRHSFVTNLLRCGMPIEMVADLANHSSIEITTRYVKGGGGRVAEWRKSQKSRLSPSDYL